MLCASLWQINATVMCVVEASNNNTLTDSMASRTMIIGHGVTSSAYVEGNDLKVFVGSLTHVMRGL